MKKEKEIPLKNYILLSIVLILTIVVVIYFFLWKNTYEKSKFKNIINKNNLNNKILYLDLTEELKENNIVKEINKKYGKEMTEVPTIVIIKDGKISSSYNIKENKYNIKLLEKYLEKEDVIND